MEVTQGSTSVFTSVTDLFSGVHSDVLQLYISKILDFSLIIVTGIVLSYIVYKIIIYVFKRFNILTLIDKLDSKMTDGISQDKKKTFRKTSTAPQTLTKRFKIDKIVAKVFSYYIFLLFFRIAITRFGILDIEEFMDELLKYLPKLFIGAIIGYFGFRFSKFIYDIVYFTMGVKSKDTAKLVAAGIRGIVIFFTIMAVLDQVGIATEVTTTILNGFIAMLAIAGGIAFGLGGKDVARDILESFRK